MTRFSYNASLSHTVHNQVGSFSLIWMHTEASKLCRWQHLEACQGVVIRMWLRGHPRDTMNSVVAISWTASSQRHFSFPSMTRFSYNAHLSHTWHNQVGSFSLIWIMQWPQNFADGSILRQNKAWSSVCDWAGIPGTEWIMMWLSHRLHHQRETFLSKNPTLENYHIQIVCMWFTEFYNELYHIKNCS